MAIYNLTNLTGATTPQELIGYANEVTDQSFMIMMLFAVFIILLIKLYKGDLAASLAVSGLVCFVFGGLFAFIGWVNLIIPLVFLVITAFSAFYMYVIDK